MRKRLQLVEASQHRLGFDVEGFSEQGGMHAAAFAHEQLVLQFSLQISDSLRDRLDGYVLLLCGR